MNEGPHLDLIDFHQLETKWLPLSKASYNIWKAPAYSDKDFSGKRDFTEKELLAEVKRLSGGYVDNEDNWLKIAKECKSDKLDSCTWTESRIEIRVVNKDLSDLSPSKIVTIFIPMGC